MRSITVYNNKNSSNIIIGPPGSDWSSCKIIPQTSSYFLFTIKRGEPGRKSAATGSSAALTTTTKTLHFATTTPILSILLAWRPVHGNQLLFYLFFFCLRCSSTFTLFVYLKRSKPEQQSVVKCSGTQQWDQARWSTVAGPSMVSR